MNHATDYARIKNAYKQHYFGLISADEYAASKRSNGKPVNGRSITSAIRQARIELRAMGQFVFIPK